MAKRDRSPARARRAMTPGSGCPRTRARDPPRRRRPPRSRRPGARPFADAHTLHGAPSTPRRSPSPRAREAPARRAGLRAGERAPRRAGSPWPRHPAAAFSGAPAPPAPRRAGAAAGRGGSPPPPARHGPAVRAHRSAECGGAAGRSVEAPATPRASLEGRLRAAFVDVAARLDAELVQMLQLEPVAAPALQRLPRRAARLVDLAARDLPEGDVEAERDRGVEIVESDRFSSSLVGSASSSRRGRAPRGP